MLQRSRAPVIRARTVEYAPIAVTNSLTVATAGIFFTATTVKSVSIDSQICAKNLQKKPAYRSKLWWQSDSD